MTTQELKKGSVVETPIDGKQWNQSTVTRVSDKFVWFNGSGFTRIAKQTFVNYPTLYRIKSI